jgi:hypothetical protein
MTSRTRIKIVVRRKTRKSIPNPNGLELLKKEPLEELKRFTATLIRNDPNRLSTWLYRYDVAIRRNEATLALQALLQAKKILEKSNADRSGEKELHTRINDFAKSNLVPHNNAKENFDCWSIYCIDGDTGSRLKSVQLPRLHVRSCPSLF